MKLPVARHTGIVAQDLGSELLIYNLTTNQAFCLNETSKRVYESCDGQISFDDLKRKCKFTDDLIHLALAELAANDLLADYAGEHFKDLSRRAAIKRVGLTSMVALPVIASLVAPKASQAASAAACSTNPPTQGIPAPAPANTATDCRAFCTSAGSANCYFFNTGNDTQCICTF